MGGEEGHREGGVMGREGRKGFVSANGRAKFFMCFWGKKIEFAACMLDCKSRRWLRAAVGCVCSGAWDGGVGSRARQSTSWRWAADMKPVPGVASKGKQKLANENHAGGCGG